MISVLVTPQSVVVSNDGVLKVFDHSKPEYRKVVDFYRIGDMKGIEDVITGFEKSVKKSYGHKGLEVREGHVFVDNEALPQNLSERVAGYLEESLPINSLLKHWSRLRKNQSARAVNELFGCLERNHHPILPDGRFLAYKGVRENYKDCRSGYFDNSPGAINEMPRRMVDDDNVNNCSYGFHVGSYEYADNFGYRTLEVAVDPADVVAVPTDCNWQKMRVCKYEVLREIPRHAGQTSSQMSYYDDDYDYEDEDDWYDEEDEPQVSAKPKRDSKGRFCS